MIVGMCLAFLMECPPNNTFRDATTETKPYVEKYIKLGNKFKGKWFEKKARQTKYYFDSAIKKNQFATCYYKINEVAINEKEWNLLPEENKEELIFHEASHCVLELGHTTAGIMKAQGLHNPEVYKRHYKFLINDLFDQPFGKFIDVQYKEKALTKADILNNTHAVVRFTAEWCPPCKVLAPIFDEVAAAHPNVKTYVIDVDKNNDLAKEFGIKGIPTMIQIKNGQIEKTVSGAQPKPEVEKLFK